MKRKYVSLKEMILANKQDQVIRVIKETRSFLKSIGGK